MFRGWGYPYTDNTQHGVAKDLVLRISSAAKESLKANKNTFFGIVSLERKSQSQKSLSLPSRLCNAIVALRRMAQFSASSQIGLFQP